MPAGDCTISEAVRQGPQIAGSDDPKITTTGIPKAAAMWAGPESFPTNRADPASRSRTSLRGAPERQRYARNGEKSSEAAPTNTGSRPASRRYCATDRNPSARQHLAGDAPKG